MHFFWANFRNSIYFLLSILILNGCREDATRTGCTDYKAVNYNSLAREDDGSCQYLDSIQHLLINGEPGYWGSYEHSGGVDFTACYGEIGTKILANDSVNGEVKTLFLVKDSTGKFGMTGAIVNPVNAMDFKHGYLTFNAMLPKTGPTKVLPLYISGPYCKNYNESCSGVCLCLPINLSIQMLTDSAFEEVVVPVHDFKVSRLNSLTDIFTIFDSIAGGNDTLLYVKDISWRTYYERNKTKFNF